MTRAPDFAVSCAGTIIEWFYDAFWFAALMAIVAFYVVAVAAVALGVPVALLMALLK